MSDTIELLECIGKDAALRYASAEDLAHALEQAGTSDALKTAAIARDSSRLSVELGPKEPQRVDHTLHAHGHEEHHDHDHDHRHHDHDHRPQHPAKPDKGSPSHDR
jgi:hypothetical protein